MTKPSSAAPIPTGAFVLANFRYLSVYNELVARISQRQQSLALFVAIFTGLVTALILSRDIFGTDHCSIVWVMVGFPFASLILTFLNYKYGEPDLPSEELPGGPGAGPGGASPPPQLIIAIRRS